MDYITLESTADSPLSIVVGMVVSVILIFTMFAAMSHEWRRSESTIGKILSASFILTAFIAIAVLLIHIFVAPSFDAASRNADTFTNAYGIDNIAFTDKSDYGSLMGAVRNGTPSTSIFTATDRKNGSIGSYKVVIDSHHHLQLFMAGNTHASGGFVLKTADYSKYK